jgi:hypothetical protein
VDEVLKALDQANLVLLIATKRSLSRKWVWFEAGRTWFTNVKCIPCCVGDVRKNELPRPLDGLTGMNLDLQEDVSALFSSCEAILCTKMASVPTPDVWSTFARLDVRAEEKQRAADLPFHTELKGKVHEQMKRMDPGSREVLRLLLMYGELTEDNATKLVKESGKYTNNTFGLNRN